MIFFEVKILKLIEDKHYFWTVRGTNGIEHLQDGTAQELLEALRVQITTDQPEKAHG